MASARSFQISSRTFRTRRAMSSAWSGSSRMMPSQSMSSGAGLPHQSKPYPSYTKHPSKIYIRVGVRTPDVSVEVLLAKTKRRIHQHHVVPLLAEVHEGEAPHSILGEEPPLKSLAVLGLLGVAAKSLNYFCFGLLEELSIGDVRHAR